MPATDGAFDTPAPRISCRFTIGGKSFDPEAATAAIGLSPTEVWAQQRDDLKTRPDLDDANWSIGFTRRPLYSTSEAIEEVLATVWPARDRIRHYLDATGLHAWFACTVTVTDDRPLYELTPDVIRKLAFLGCGYLLDILDYSE